MKKLLVVAALVAALVAPAAAQDVCKRLENTVGQVQPFVAETEGAVAYYFHSIQDELQELIDEGIFFERIPVHIFLKSRNITCMGEVWVEKRLDKTYWVCEDSCDFKAGEVIKARENRCRRIN